MEVYYTLIQKVTLEISVVTHISCDGVERNTREGQDVLKEQKEMKTVLGVCIDSLLPTFQ